jgi:hypothetical protein
MSHQQKENWISLIGSIFTTIPFFIYTLSKYLNGQFSDQERMSFLASSILILIGLRIVVQIVLYVLYEIIFVARYNTKPSTIVDERDKLMRLKSYRNAYFAMGLGTFLTFLLAAYNKTTDSTLIMLFATGFAAEFVEKTSNILYAKLEN